MWPNRFLLANCVATIVLQLSLTITTLLTVGDKALSATLALLAALWIGAGIWLLRESRPCRRALERPSRVPCDVAVLPEHVIDGTDDQLSVVVPSEQPRCDPARFGFAPPVPQQSTRLSLNDSLVSADRHDALPLPEQQQQAGTVEPVGGASGSQPTRSSALETRPAA